MKKKDNKRKQQLAQKGATEALKFQAHFGLRLQGHDEKDPLHELADAEIENISRLGLAQDLLELKKLVEGVKESLQIIPTPHEGDLSSSAVAVALGCSGILSAGLTVPAASSSGFTTSTYLGIPIIKFSKIFIILNRTRTSKE